MAPRSSSVSSPECASLKSPEAAVDWPPEDDLDMDGVALSASQLESRLVLSCKRGGR